MKYGKQSLFYCSDCDAYIGCFFTAHDAFIRCFGSGSHCIVCESPAITELVVEEDTTRILQERPIP